MGSSGVQALQKDKKSPTESQAKKCLEQNLQANSDATLPCVEVPPLPTSTATPPPVAPPTEVPSEKKLVRELPAYKSGYFLHPETVKFCELLTQEIDALNQTGHKIELIVITGYADGERNRGVLKGREPIPDRCQKIAPNPTINDKELAGLRGCSIWDLLSGLLEGKKAQSGFGWRPDSIQDIEDGGLSGDPYRKVVVEVIWQ